MATKTEPGAATRPDIVRTLHIDAPIEDVWTAITEGDEIQRWFAPHAESRPGPGGIIKLAWSSDATWDMPIAEWDPPRRLVIGDEGADGTEALGDASHADKGLRIEYTLESKSGGTELRLVHSGFGAGAEWDTIYDGTCTGWSYELRALKHYLEHHKGQRRRLVRAGVPVEIPLDQAWTRVFGPEAIGLDADPRSIGEGDRFEARPAKGSPLSGRVVMRSPTCLGIELEQFNRALLRVQIDKGCSSNGQTEAAVWLSAHDVEDRVVDEFQRDWNDVLSRVFAS